MLTGTVQDAYKLYTGALQVPNGLFHVTSDEELFLSRFSTKSMDQEIITVGALYRKWH